MSYYRYGFAVALAMGAMSATSSRALAVSYASNITKTGTTVNFILNSPADALTYSINGGAPVALDGTTKGAKTFNLTSASDTFSISAARNDTVGFTIPIGGTKGTAGTGWANGLSQETPLAGLNILTDDANILNRFNSPRGIDVSNNPNAPNFGTVYISNSAAGSVPDALPALARTLVDEGLYALRADQTDAFGYGDTAKNPTASDGFPSFSTASTNSPFRVFVSDAGDVFVADYSDVNGNVFAVNSNFTASQIMLAGIGGKGWNNADADPNTAGVQYTVPPDNTDVETSIPLTQFHGSISGIHVEGSFAQNNLVLYGVDEDLNSAHIGNNAALEKNDRNMIWKWDIGGTPSATGSPVVPTKVGGGMIGWFPLGGITVDMERGADGKFYLSQYRSTGNEVGIQVIDAAGTELFNSLTKTREIVGNPAAVDIFRNTFEIAVSPDQKWMAAIVNVGDVVVMPLVDGIPDIAARMVVDTLPDVNSARGITFDAAGNIHYVSSGQQLYRVLAPGGNSVATTTWNGTDYDFTVETIGGGLAGDFNGDDVVNGADFLVWQKGGSPNPLSQADLTLWKTNFGTSAAAPAVGAVPEPTALALAGLSVMALAAVRRRK